jgi:hypothetical protein
VVVHLPLTLTLSPLRGERESWLATLSPLSGERESRTRSPGLASAEDDGCCGFQGEALPPHSLCWIPGLASQVASAEEDLVV